MPTQNEPMVAESVPAAPNTIFSPQQFALLDKARVPAHIAIIPDGNRRWAKKKLSNITSGYRVGADNLLNIVKAAKEIGVKVITFYVFSTENWNRSSLETSTFMWLLESYLIEQCQSMIEQGVRLQTIGNISRLSENIQKTLRETKAATAHCDKIEMVMAINYGSRDEICRAVHSILDDCQADRLKKEEVTETVIKSYLDTASWVDPDLLIRTSGELRISNFLLWQCSYAEFYTAEVLWPEFTSQHLLEAVLHFQNRQRRLGGP